MRHKESVRWKYSSRWTKRTASCKKNFKVKSTSEGVRCKVHRENIIQTADCSLKADLSLVARYGWKRAMLASHSSEKPFFPISDESKAVVPNLGSPDVLGLKLLEAFSTSCGSQISGSRSSRKPSGSCSSRKPEDPRMGTTDLREPPGLLGQPSAKRIQRIPSLPPLQSAHLFSHVMEYSRLGQIREERDKSWSSTPEQMGS